jgi:predicted transcriptional regulator
MRTTVTLDPDVERLLKEKARRSRQSFKQVLNNAIRQGLREDDVAARPKKAFRVKARPMRLRVGIDPARMSEVGDELEVEAFLETTRRLRENSS